MPPRNFPEKSSPESLEREDEDERGEVLSSIAPAFLRGSWLRDGKGESECHGMNLAENP